MRPSGYPTGALPPGTILGAFEVLSPLGQGGMGAVYRVRNRVTGGVRALKLILPELAADPSFVERFVREIRLAMAIEHPNLVHVFEPGMDGDLIFLPMELLEGESLSARLKRDGAVPLYAAVGLLQPIASALAALHSRGILHRDVKPSNVFLSYENNQIVPKLLDLGAGKEVGQTEEATATGLAIGSPHYMAPEQASGRKDLDARADQYSLGVLAYQLLTGARPYENDDTGHVLAKVLSGAPYRKPRELRPEIPVEFEAAILRAMSRDKEERFPTIEEFVNAMAARPSGVGVGADPPPMSFEATRIAPLSEPATGPSGVERSGTMNASIVSSPPQPPPVTKGTTGGRLGVGVLVGAALAALLVIVLVVTTANRGKTTRGASSSSSRVTALGASSGTGTPTSTNVATPSSTMPSTNTEGPKNVPGRTGTGLPGTPQATIAATTTASTATTVPDPSSPAPLPKRAPPVAISPQTFPPASPASQGAGTSTNVTTTAPPVPHPTHGPKPTPLPTNAAPDPCHATPGAPCL